MRTKQKANRQKMADETFENMVEYTRNWLLRKVVLSLINYSVFDQMFPPFYKLKAAFVEGLNLKQLPYKD